MRALCLERSAVVLGLVASIAGGGAVLACTTFSAEPGADDAGSEAGPEGASSADGAPGPACVPTAISGDPANCGRCGHSCLGGTCAAGACQPAILATFSATSVYGPVVDAARVVVATDDKAAHFVQWCAKSGCAGGLRSADLATTPTSIASSGTDVFVATVGGPATTSGVFRVGDGTVTAITPVDGTFQNANQLTTFGTDVYFINAYQKGPIGIYRVPAAGGAPPVQVVPVQPTDRFSQLVAVQGRIFASDFQAIATCAGATCPALAPYAAPSVTKVDVTALAADDTRVFWTSDTKALLFCDVGASCSAATQLAGATSLEEGVPITLARQGSDLYVTTEDGKIFACTAASCATTFHRIASDEVVVGPAAADEAAVYWVGRERTDAGGGTTSFRLMRLAK